MITATLVGRHQVVASFRVARTFLVTASSLVGRVAASSLADLVATSSLAADHMPFVLVGPCLVDTEEACLLVVRMPSVLVVPYLVGTVVVPFLVGALVVHLLLKLRLGRPSLICHHHFRSHHHCRLPQRLWW